MSEFSYGLDYKPKGRVLVTERAGRVLVEHVFEVVKTNVELGNVINDPDVERKGVLEYKETRVGHDYQDEETRYDAPEDVFDFLEKKGFTVKRRV